MTDEPLSSEERALLEIGLTENESRVYLALLRLGEAPVGEITDGAKMHRSTVYDALERLCQKGVISHMVKNDMKLYAAADPEFLLNLVKEKELKLKQLLPKLELERSLAAKEKTSAQVFEGVKALRIVQYEFLDYDQPIVVFGLPKITPEIIKYFIDDFHRSRIKRKIWMKHIYNEDAQQRINYLNSLPYTEAKYLPERFNTPVSTMICSDVVLIIDWTKPMTFIRIKSQALADTYKKYFEVLYKEAA